MNKALAIQSALHCFTCGLLSFIPLIGIPFVVAAMIFHVKVSGHAPDDWHVARRYAKMGMSLAGIGLVLNVTAALLAALAWIANH